MWLSIARMDNDQAVADWRAEERQRKFRWDELTPGGVGRIEAKLESSPNQTARQAMIRLLERRAKRLIASMHE